MQCSLPKVFRSLCQTGCVYRETAFKHLKCPMSNKTDACVAPCKQPCVCSQVPKTDSVLPKNPQQCLQ